MFCPKCERDLKRSARAGFVERVILPRMDIYPFRCRNCGIRIYADGRDAAHELKRSRAKLLMRMDALHMLPNQMSERLKADREVACNAALAARPHAMSHS